MKVSDLIAHLQEFHDMDEDIYCGYWTGGDILDNLEYMYNYSEKCPPPKECVPYIISMLEKYNTGFDNDELWSAINEHFDSWLKKQDKETQ